MNELKAFQGAGYGLVIERYFMKHRLIIDWSSVQVTSGAPLTLTLGKCRHSPRARFARPRAAAQTTKYPLLAVPLSC